MSKLITSQKSDSKEILPVSSQEPDYNLLIERTLNLYNLDKTSSKLNRLDGQVWWHVSQQDMDNNTFDIRFLKTYLTFSISIKELSEN